jgi:hypothetical protein
VKTVDLGRAAANAEVLRLKRMMGRQVTRVVFGVVAVVFLIGALILLHVVGYLALRPYLTPLVASAVVLAVDLVIAIICGVLAMRNSPDAIEVEAKLLRDQSIMAMKDSLKFAALVGPVGAAATRLLGRKRGAGLTLAALVASLLAGKRN